jgi:hypothetical protein
MVLFFLAVLWDFLLGVPFFWSPGFGLMFCHSRRECLGRVALGSSLFSFWLVSGERNFCWVKSSYVFGGSLAVPVLVGSGKAELRFAVPVRLGQGKRCFLSGEGFLSLRWVGSIAVPVLLVGEEQCLGFSQSSRIS